MTLEAPLSPRGGHAANKATGLLELRTDRGMTALMLAVAGGNATMARALVKAGARTAYAEAVKLASNRVWRVVVSDYVSMLFFDRSIGTDSGVPTRPMRAQVSHCIFFHRIAGQFAV